MNRTPKTDSPKLETPPTSSRLLPAESRKDEATGNTLPNPRTLADRNRGGQPGNRNSLRHGLRAGKLPADAAYIENRLNGFRRQLEDTVIEAKGGVSLSDAAYIQTALRWERHAALAQRWLTKQQDELKPIDRLAFSREIAKASAERDKAIAALGLDAKDNKLPWIEGFVESKESEQ